MNAAGTRGHGIDRCDTRCHAAFDANSEQDKGRKEKSNWHECGATAVRWRFGLNRRDTHCHAAFGAKSKQEIPCYLSSLREGGVVRATRFEYTEGQVNEFPHGGANDEHRRLASVFEATRERLQTGGNTAVYDSLIAAYRQFDTAAGKDRFVSIVLMTDGESNRGKDLPAFKRFLAGRPTGAVPVPVFPILFGEAAEPQMRQIASATGGDTWDARGGDLTRAFCEVRGYQ